MQSAPSAAQNSDAHSIEGADRLSFPERRSACRIGIVNPRQRGASALKVTPSGRHCRNSVLAAPLTGRISLYTLPRAEARGYRYGAPTERTLRQTALSTAASAPCGRQHSLLPPAHPAADSPLYCHQYQPKPAHPAADCTLCCRQHHPKPAHPAADSTLCCHQHSLLPPAPAEAREGRARRLRICMGVSCGEGERAVGAPYC